MTDTNAATAESQTATAVRGNLAGQTQPSVRTNKLTLTVVATTVFFRFLQM